MYEETREFLCKNLNGTQASNKHGFGENIGL